jgi:DNA-binding CsgD family transcriptional regulator
MRPRVFSRGCREAVMHRQNGNPSFPPGGAGSSIFTAAEWLALARTLRLSDRELEILKFIFDDRSEREIAHRLCLSQHTIHTYLARLYAKLGVTGRSSAIVRTCTIFIEMTRQRGEMTLPAADQASSERSRANMGMRQSPP